MGTSLLRPNRPRRVDRKDPDMTLLIGRHHHLLSGIHLNLLDLKRGGSQSIFSRAAALKQT